MDGLRDIVKAVVKGYATTVINGRSYFTHNDEDTVFTVFVTSRIQGKYESFISLIVRIEGDLVIVERDQNDKIVKDALLQAGVPRERIILAYAGEAVPERA
jgi:vancomycin permeability regulator SanA